MVTNYRNDTGSPGCLTPPPLIEKLVKLKLVEIHELVIMLVETRPSKSVQLTSRKYAAL